LFVVGGQRAGIKRGKALPSLMLKGGRHTPCHLARRSAGQPYPHRKKPKS
tara:strand:- start:5186 stop:5335 length:150 start_codon:yes stop_codon:yes gene_type:complete